MRCGLCVLALAALGCTEITDSEQLPPDAGLELQVEVLEVHDVDPLNDGLVADLATANVAFYFTEDGPLSWDDLQSNIARARDIFAEAGVQLRIDSAQTLRVPTDWQSLDAAIIDEPTTPPELRESDLYRHLEGLHTRPTARTTNIFRGMIAHREPSGALSIPDERTVHILALRDVPISFYEWDGQAWVKDAVPTGGLSHPSYVYHHQLPAPLRGVITLSFEQERFNPRTRVLAHELGHKLINVSHEGRTVCPSFEADGPELMLYGNGEDIPAGADGRYHRERLLLSPFLFTLDGDGEAIFANEYRGDGGYRDPLYSSLFVDPPCS